MPLPLPNLDDRNFAQLTEEARRIIAQHAPGWTDLSPSDPGIVLLEVFAHLTETMIYRLNLLPQKAYIAFLGLLGVSIHPPSAASVTLHFSRSRPGDQPIEIPRGTRVTVGRSDGASEPPVFLTSSTVTIAGTAAISQGYANDPDDHGLLLIESREELNRLIRRIHDLGYQACVHANGDIAINMLLDAIERAQQVNPVADARHRIEHCTMIDDNILKRMARLKMMALPFVSYLWQHGEKLRPFYGARADRMFAHKSFLKAGVKVASGSDHPVGLHSPLLGIQCMATRKTAAGETIGLDERISLEEAVRVYTADAAYATGEENLKGRLKPNMLADAVVLNQDPWQVNPDEIGSIDVAMTIVGGKIVFQKN